MANPFKNSNRLNNPTGNIRELYRAMSQSTNPYEMFMRLASQNPNMQPIINAIKSGNSPESVFKSMCQQRGINPQEFVNSITK